LRGCPCTKENEPACGNTELGLCTENGCNGLFNEHDGFGICQDQFKGCPCKRE
jgi:hypothetical protein